MRTCVSILLVLTAACTADHFDPSKDDAGNPIPDPVGGDGGVVDGGSDAVWVSSSKGTATGDGTKAHPLASLDAAIAKAGKLPVNACAETYAEQVHFANGVNVYGYYDCNAGWIKSTAHAKIAPTVSPAALASNITTATRVEAVDIVAPDFTDKSQSSIALVANHAGALTIANATIHAGTGGKGADGASGIQLTESGSKNGADGWADGVCNGCSTLYLSMMTAQAAGGSNACVGESGHDPGPGGQGGSPGLYQSVYFNGWIWSVQNNEYTTAGYPTSSTQQTAQGGTFGVAGSTGAPGANGTNGVGGLSFGVLGANGYVPSDGSAGTSGGPGQGGGGSGGYNYLSSNYPASAYSSHSAWGSAGAGGGAGGCPGLVGQPGKGGGASIAIVAIAAGLTLDTVTIESSKGGDGGAAGASSQPTAGGFGGHPPSGGAGVQGGGNGGNGGYAGASGAGGGGPSIGIAYDKTKPTLLASPVKFGAGGSGVQTTPPSDNGMSADAYMFNQ